MAKRIALFQGMSALVKVIFQKALFRGNTNLGSTNQDITVILISLFKSQQFSISLVIANCFYFSIVWVKSVGTKTRLKGFSP